MRLSFYLKITPMMLNNDILLNKYTSLIKGFYGNY